MTERLEEIEIKERQEVKLETETVYKKEERPERRETESVSEQVRRGLRITTGREAPALPSCPCSWDPRAAFDGGGQTSEQPQPGQQRLYNLLVQQPEHQEAHQGGKQGARLREEEQCTQKGS